MRTQGIFGTLATLIPLGLSLPIDDPSTFCAADTIERDVAIVGGGSSGAHAAVRVKDSGKTVVVIEKAGELGGHVKTYTAASGIRVNYGPSNFQPYPVVRDFFGRFNISLVRYEQPGVGDIYADFATGKSVPNGTIPVPDFTAYLEQVNKYPYLDQSWDLPQPVPEDLLLPFGQFVAKYHLENVAYYIAQFAIGNGNVFQQPTVYILKAVSNDYIQSVVFGQAVVPVTYDTHSLFERALTFLGSDALLSSTVTSAMRSNTGVKLVVNTPQGRKLIKAKKLLITAPPTIDNMKPFGLDTKEQNIFSQFQYKALYVALLNNTGLQEGYRYYNAVPKNDTNYHVPKLPELEFIWTTRDKEIFWMWYSSPTDLSESRVKSDITAALKNLAPGSDPNFLVYYNTTPVGMGVTADQIENGFYDDALALQGHKSTWYTGAAWVSDHSATLWNHTEHTLLPVLTK